MTENHIDELLDELVPPFEPEGSGWPDVLGRARRARRRYAALGAVALALVLVPTAVALGGKVGDLFHGTPAPPAVSSSFEANNRMADMATQQGFADKFPHADVSQAHGVLEVQTPDGPEDLWVAPDDQGGHCWWVDWANDPVTAAGQFGFGGCDRADQQSGIEPGTIWVEAHPTLQTLWGRVYVQADRVVVGLEDGSSSTLPVVEGGFLASLSRHAKVERVTAYEGDNEVASWEAPVG
jgi:hypothetical protein